MPAAPGSQCAHNKKISPDLTGLPNRPGPDPGLFHPPISPRVLTNRNTIAVVKTAGPTISIFANRCVIPSALFTDPMIPPHDIIFATYSDRSDRFDRFQILLDSTVD
jgi:hypothetical protein